MAIDYNDARFQTVEAEKQNALNETRSMYDSMINNSDSYYQKQIDATNDYAKQQQQLQQQQTDLAVEQINQQKDQAEKDYLKEQKGAYVDYQKASNQYGVNAEKLASQGLTNTGYAESTKSSMFNTYQNRYATARETYNKSILNYDNGIKEAQLANSSKMAEIAYNALQQQLSLGLEQYKYKNTLLESKLNALNNTEDRYYSRYQDVVNQINTENSLAEQIRQYNESLALQKQQLAISKTKNNKKTSDPTSLNSNGIPTNLENTVAAALKASSLTKEQTKEKVTEKVRNLIYNQVGNSITEDQARDLFDRYGL